MFLNVFIDFDVLFNPFLNVMSTCQETKTNISRVRKMNQKPVKTHQNVSRWVNFTPKGPLTCAKWVLRSQNSLCFQVMTFWLQDKTKPKIGFKAFLKHLPLYWQGCWEPPRRPHPHRVAFLRSNEQNVKKFALELWRKKEQATTTTKD